MSNLQEISTEELEKLLEARKQKELKEAQDKRHAYETKKNDLVKILVQQASELNEGLTTFKKAALEELDAFYQLMHEYGDVAKNNKGNFSIKSLDGTLRVDYKKQINYSFDERAALADQKLKEFLMSFVKKRDNDAYELITSLLEKDKAGNYDPRLIQKLYKFEDKFSAPEWKDAIRLFKESYQESHTAVYIQFHKIEGAGKSHSINLNFSSI